MSAAMCPTDVKTAPRRLNEVQTFAAEIRIPRDLAVESFIGDLNDDATIL